MLRAIEDSRGRRREVFPAAASWIDDPAAPPVRARGGIAKCVLVVACLAGVVVVLIVLLPPQMLLVAVPVGVSGLAASFIFLTGRTRRTAPAYDTFAALLSNGYCPCCAYRIDNIRPEHDGCTVCPECGAAWRR